MKTGGKVLIGSILGMIVTAIISSTYFYNFVRRLVKGINESLRDFNY
jgi:uncharacterized protein (DUF2062 family)